MKNVPKDTFLKTTSYILQVKQSVTVTPEFTVFSEEWLLISLKQSNFAIFVVIILPLLLKTWHDKYNSNDKRVAVYNFDDLQII